MHSKLLHKAINNYLGDSSRRKKFEVLAQIEAAFYTSNRLTVPWFFSKIPKRAILQASQINLTELAGLDHAQIRANSA